MESLVLLMIFTLMLVLILGVLFLMKGLSKKEKIEVDYYLLFILGIIWLVIGLFGNWGLFAIGLLFFIFGWVHRDKWEEERRDWESLNKKEKAIMILIIGFLIILVAGGVGVFVG